MVKYRWSSQIWRIIQGNSSRGGKKRCREVEKLQNRRSTERPEETPREIFPRGSISTGQLCLCFLVIVLVLVTNQTVSWAWNRKVRSWTWQKLSNVENPGHAIRLVKCIVPRWFKIKRVYPHMHTLPTLTFILLHMMISMYVYTYKCRCRAAHRRKHKDKSAIVIFS